MMFNLLLLSLLASSLSTQAARTLGTSYGESFYVLQDDGSIYGLGRNSNGMLGVGNTNIVKTPTKMLNIVDVSMVSGSNGHACVIDQGGVKCVGGTTFGKLGVGSTSSSSFSTPVSSTGLASGAVKVVAGEEHTCALLQTGSVRCFGDNSDGELGDGTTDVQRVSVAVAGFETGGAIDIALGKEHTCLITSNGGQVMCCGGNDYGQLGDETTTARSNMTAVHGLGSSAYVAISSGTNHVCALSSTGAMYCWGNDNDGQLGRNKEASAGYSMIAQQPNGLAGVAVHSIWLGQKNTFAILSVDKSILAFGDAAGGVLGQGTTTDQATPQSFLGGETGFRAITGGSTAVCFMTEDDSETVSCLGSNSYNQVNPTGTTTTYHSPVVMAGLPITTLQPTSMPGTIAPTQATLAPTQATLAPTQATLAPNQATFAPTQATFAPTQATLAPNQSTFSPTHATDAPSHPTASGTNAPSHSAMTTQNPTRRPTARVSTSNANNIGASAAVAAAGILILAL